MQLPSISESLEAISGFLSRYRYEATVTLNGNTSASYIKIKRVLPHEAQGMMREIRDFRLAGDDNRPLTAYYDDNNRCIIVRERVPINATIDNISPIAEIVGALEKIGIVVASPESEKNLGVKPMPAADTKRWATSSPSPHSSNADKYARIPSAFNPGTGR